MSNSIFKPSETATKPDAEAQPVVAENGGEVSQVKNERTYTAEQMEVIVRDRLARQKKQFEKQLAEQQSKDEGKKPSPAIEDDYKSRLAAYEAEKKQLAERLTKYRQEGLKAKVMTKLSEAGCVEPADVTEVLLAKGLVKLDDDDQVYVENVNNSLDDLVGDYLAKRPYLVKPTVAGGVGTKGPSAPAVPVVPTDPKQMTREQMEAALGIKTPNSKKLWGK